MPPPLTLPPCRRLEKMIEALLSTLRETELSDAIPSLIQVFENFMRGFVKVTQAENGRSKLDAAPLSLSCDQWLKHALCVRGHRANTARPSPCLPSSELLLSLPRPVITLMVEITTLVNSTHVNLSKVVEGMQRAIEDTVKAAQQV